MYAEIAKAVFVKSNPVRYEQYLLSKGRKHKADVETDEIADGVTQ